MKKKNTYATTYATFFAKHFTIKWGKKGVGFGQFVFYREGNRIRIDNEYMSKDFIKEIINELIDSAILDNP